MIDEKTYSKFLDEGLLMDHWYILYSVKEGKKLSNSKRSLGFRDLLKLRGYLNNDEQLTEKGRILFEERKQETGKKVVKFIDWAIDIYKKCQNKILELTGKNQIYGTINNSKHQFLCNERDFCNVLYKTMKSYNIKDTEKVEKCLIKHITSCHNSRNWFPLMQYYIIKEGTSRLVTDVQNFSGEEESTDSSLFHIA